MSDEDVNRKIGSLIRVVRKAIRMTQGELAKEVGVSTQQIHKYETGHDVISVQKLKHIADIFGCDISVLLPKQIAKVTNVLKIAQKKDGFKIGKKTQKNEAISLLKIFFSCNKDDREKIINFAKDLTEDK